VATFSRNRAPSQPVTGANLRIITGLFGPIGQHLPSDDQGIYNFYQGDVITAGAAETAVFEPVFELPLVTIWGKGFVRGLDNNPNVFAPFQPNQVIANPNIVTNGLGGPMAGQMALQPLMSNDEASL
jgi:hypothetical protein